MFVYSLIKYLVLKGFYFIKRLYLSFPAISEVILLTIAFLGSGRLDTLFFKSSKDSKGFSFLASIIAIVCFLPNPGSNSN